MARTRRISALRLSALLAIWGAVVARDGGAFTFQVTIDSSSVVGQAGKIAFDLTNADPVENSVSLTTPQFTGGGAITGKETNGGQSIGGLFDNTGDPTSIQDFAVGTGGVHLPEFYTSLVIDVTWGMKTTFTLQANEGSTPGSIPDLLAVYLLDPTTNVPLYATGDPLGTGALFAVAFDESGGCLFLPEASAVPVKLALMNEIGEPFNTCIEGGLKLGKSTLTFARKTGRDAFAVQGTLVSPIALDLAAGGGTFFLTRNGAQFFSDAASAFKKNKKETKFTGKGTGGLKALQITTKDHTTFMLKARGAKVDLSAANTGANETIGVGIQSRTTKSASGVSPAGSATFTGDGAFRRKKKQLKFP